MRIDSLLILSTLFSPFVAALAVPDSDVGAPLEQRDEHARAEELWKRKGGGGSGGKGGSSGSGSSGGKGGKGSSGSSSSGSGSSGSGSSGTGSSGTGSSGSSGSRGRGSSSSNTGGSTKTGSGTPRSFGGGKYYGGGAATPYRAGGISPLGIAPFFFFGAALAFWPGVWLYGAHTYYYPHNHQYYNQTAAQNQSKPVICGCDPYQECGCDENNATDYWDNVIGNGVNYNTSILAVADVNGTSTLLLNGTLPNGTTAPGGDEDAFSDSAFGMRNAIEALGYWPMVVASLAAVFLV